MRNTGHLFRAFIQGTIMTTFTTLINTDELSAHIDDPAWVIIDCRFNLADTEAGRQDYAQAHIPNARYAHLDDDLSSPVMAKTGRHPLPNPDKLAKKLGSWGVDATKQVVVYDDAGGAIAGRLWWMLRWLGHNRVALLNGGLKAWQAAGLPLSTETVEAVSTKFPLQHAELERDALYVTADEVDQLRQDESYRVIDARAPQRFSGEVEPLDRIAGHIPGSINMPWDKNVQIDGIFKPKQTLQKMFEQQLGDVTPEHVIHSCGSGVTACHNLIAMEYAGLAGSKLYPGSWSEWITDPNRAVEKG